MTIGAATINQFSQPMIGSRLRRAEHIGVLTVGQNDGLFKTVDQGTEMLSSINAEAGRHTGSAATPSRAVRRRGPIAICATEATLDVLLPAAKKLTN